MPPCKLRADTEHPTRPVSASQPSGDDRLEVFGAALPRRGVPQVPSNAPPQIEVASSSAQPATFRA